LSGEAVFLARKRGHSVDLLGNARCARQSGRRRRISARVRSSPRSSRRAARRSP